MSVDGLLSRLEKIRKTGAGRWVSCCPSHDSKSGASLAVREIDDGRVLIHCFGGCSTDEVLSAIGLTFSDLFPERLGQDRYPRERRPFNAGDVLRCLSFESILIYQYANAVAQGEVLDQRSRERLLIAVSRFQHGAEVANAG